MEQVYIIQISWVYPPYLVLGGIKKNWYVVVTKKDKKLWSKIVFLLLIIFQIENRENIFIARWKTTTNIWLQIIENDKKNRYNCSLEKRHFAASKKMWKSPVEGE